MFKEPLKRLLITFAVTGVFVAQSQVVLAASQEAIDFLQEKNVVTAESLLPDKPITRGEFVMWLLKANGFVDESYQSKTGIAFQDVAPGTSSYPYVSYLLDLGALRINPTTPLFHPQASMNRLTALELSFFINGVPVPKIFDRSGWKITTISPAAPFAPTIHKAVEFGIVQSQGAFYPFARLKKGEAAEYIYRTANGMPTVRISIGTNVDQSLNREQAFRIFLNTWEKIHGSYIRKSELKNNSMLYGAIEGMVKELGDPYSEFARPEENVLVDELSGELQGIGAVVELHEEGLVVVSPIKNSPAEKAGLLPGDVILSADETKLKGLSLQKAVSLIKGPAGTIVNLSVKRDGGEPFSLLITRGVVHVRSAEIYFTEDNIAVVSISSFGAQTTFEFMQAMTEISKKKPKGIVVDLRNNPGGYLETSVEIAGFFIENGKAIVYVEYPNKTDVETSRGSGALAAFPVRVLVNKGSASAAEILAGALQDYEVAKVIGERSFGKGTVQELTSYVDGSSLKITVGRWLTPKKHVIQDNGIIPDTEVALSADDKKADRDPQLQRALQDLQ